jgi:ABC-2 type transport system permease protein
LAAGLAAFLFSLLAGVLAMGAVDGIMNAATLITLDYRGAAHLISMITAFFSGNLLPLTLFPDSWQRWITATPFAQALDVPIRFYTGQLLPGELGWMLLGQLGWTVAMVVIGRSMWQAALRRMVVQGG